MKNERIKEDKKSVLCQGKKCDSNEIVSYFCLDCWDLSIHIFYVKNETVRNKNISACAFALLVFSVVVVSVVRGARCAVDVVLIALKSLICWRLFPAPHQNMLIIIFLSARVWFLPYDWLHRIAICQSLNYDAFFVITLKRRIFVYFIEYKNKSLEILKYQTAIRYTHINNPIKIYSQAATN